MHCVSRMKHKNQTILQLNMHTKKLRSLYNRGRDMGYSSAVWHLPGKSKVVDLVLGTTKQQNKTENTVSSYDS